MKGNKLIALAGLAAMASGVLSMRKKREKAQEPPELDQGSF